jgi:predicted dehydrogenase
MSKLPTSLMLIGCGRHAFRNHLPALFTVSERWTNLVIVDVEDQLPRIREGIEASFASLRDRIVYIGLQSADLSDQNSPELPGSLAALLGAAVKKHSVDKVIIATDPEYHVAYACWALQSDLHMQMDKPISAPRDLRTNAEAVRRIYADYHQIYDVLQDARAKNPTLVCNILAQRRAHVGFQAVLELIKEVAVGYGVGVTAFQSLHSDGQWRPPHEIIAQDYHTYNRGYGKGLHSGYHCIDIVNYMVRQSWQNLGLQTNVSAKLAYPDDYLAAFPAATQYKLLGAKINEAELSKIHDELSGANYSKYGEISAHLLVDYQNRDNKKITTGTVSLLHDSVSQRDWGDADDHELYKNGRVRHETHYFVSGPLQAIKVVALESDDAGQTDGIGVGEAWNFDIHVFRNAGVMKGSSAYQLISIDELYKKRNRRLTDPLKDSRTLGLQDFFDCVDGGNISSQSDYMDHAGTMRLIMQMYQSALQE